MKFTSIVFTCLIALSTAQARIGETDTEIATRYGDPTEKLEGYSLRHHITTHKHSELTIIVEFLDGRSQREIFKRQDNEAMTDAQIETLLQANQFNSTWDVKKVCASLNRFAEWTLGDKLYARYDCDRYLFFIETLQFRAYEDTAKPASEAGKLKGF